MECYDIGRECMTVLASLFTSRKKQLTVKPNTDNEPD